MSLCVQVPFSLELQASLKKSNPQGTDTDYSKGWKKERRLLSMQSVPGEGMGAQRAFLKPRECTHHNSWARENAQKLGINSVLVENLWLS